MRIKKVFLVAILLSGGLSYFGNNELAAEPVGKIGV